jgi:hypothetical protein
VNLFLSFFFFLLFLVNLSQETISTNAPQFSELSSSKQKAIHFLQHIFPDLLSEDWVRLKYKSEAHSTVLINTIADENRNNNAIASVQNESDQHESDQHENESDNDNYHNNFHGHHTHEEDAKFQDEELRPAVIDSAKKTSNDNKSKEGKSMKRPRRTEQEQTAEQTAEQTVEQRSRNNTRAGRLQAAATTR